MPRPDPTPLPPDDEARALAAEAVVDLQRLAVEKAARFTVRIGGDGVRAVTLTVPRAAIDALAAALRHLARGDAASVEGLPPALSPREAARVLGVPRSTVARLLAAGALPSAREGAHIRLPLVDLAAGARADAAAREEALDALAREGQALGLGY
jgi:excisionase family DNA binding protein